MPQIFQVRAALIVAMTLVLFSKHDAVAEPAVPQPAWGKIEADAARGLWVAEVREAPADGRLKLPRSVPHISGARLERGDEFVPLVVAADADRKDFIVELPRGVKLAQADRIRLEMADRSAQFTDGRITFVLADARRPAAGDAEQAGRANGTIAPVEWQYLATRPGMYEVELIYALDEGETEANIAVGEKKLAAQLPATGKGGRFVTHRCGKVYVPAAGILPIALHLGRSDALGVLELNGLTLRPTCEGKPPVVADDGTLTCHARDVTIRGVKAQYEPKPEKNTVGYWVNEKDWVYWDFSLDKAGEYRVEILQGCGKGHGGSEARVVIAGQELKFTVEDTGHFQNFVPRDLGAVKLAAGKHRLMVMPIRKASIAVMDVRQVRLIPVK